MQIREILKITEHRPWPIPSEKWKFYQEWNNAIFLHWKVHLADLKKFVPEQIEIDLFEGHPWVSLVAFTMEKIRPKHFPTLSPISNFHEINIRTYVKYGEKQGVYFLSIEGGNSVSCFISKGLSGLPYRYSKMKRQNGIYESGNSQFKDRFLMKYEIGENVKAKEPLDLWLTERYALFQNTKTAISKYEIHHIEWPIQKIDIEKLNIRYGRFIKLLTQNPHRAGYSQGVQVIAWGQQKTLLK